jgi:hypothetical protein
VSSGDSEALVGFYETIKRINWCAFLRGYRPDRWVSIVNIHGFICDLFEIVDEVVVFACDAISFDYFNKSMRPRLSTEAQVGLLSSVFPTTTGAAWPSIITGTHPWEHGIYGTSFLHEKYSQNYLWINHTLNHKGMRHVPPASASPLNLSGHPTIFETLMASGIPSHYAGTHGVGSENLFRRELVAGAVHVYPDPVEYRRLKFSPSELLSYFLTLTDDILNREPGKKLIWNYVDFDDYIHENGYESLSRSLSWQDLFDYWNAQSRANRAFILISDHGQIPQKRHHYDVLKESAVNPDLAADTGGAGRTLFLYPRSGRESAVAEWIRGIIGDTGVLLEKSDLVKYSLVGSNAVADKRLGRWIAVAVSGDFISIGSSYVAEHGALSAGEMYVPIVIQ